MKIVITGAAGLLGVELWKVLESDAELFAFGRTKPIQTDVSHWLQGDLRDPQSTYRLITGANPDLVLHSAAFNDVDAAEKNPDEAFRVNALGARNLAQACQRFDSALFMVSTDYVFGATHAPDQGFSEYDPPAPINQYGRSKLAGENYVRELASRWTIARTSWLFGPARQTFVEKIVQSAIDGLEIPCLSDIVSAPTYVVDLAQAIRQLIIDRRLGLYHLSNSGFCSRVGLAEKVLQLNGLSGRGKIKSLLQDQLKLPARRPAHSGLRNHVWSLDGYQSLPSFDNALSRHFKKPVVVP